MEEELYRLKTGSSAVVTPNAHANIPRTQDVFEAALMQQELENQQRNIGINNHSHSNHINDNNHINWNSNTNTNNIINNETQTINNNHNNHYINSNDT